ncbi:glycosyltransferase family 4 protein [Paraglaciecola sp.]|uniref:glycosyltransferase family 4 protein n=1 Tax=Paraglaciecola sp. TaxID=1920173 RepID=UPI003EF88211
MKISFPYTFAGSGSDIWTINIARQLEKKGIDTEVQVFPKHFQHYPYLLRSKFKPNGADIIHTNSWTGAGFYQNELPHVTTEHLVVHDPLVSPYKAVTQKMFHKIVYQHERLAFNNAQAITAVSQYSANKVVECFGNQATAIQNGIDTEQFYIKTPLKDLNTKGKGKVKLLFVGNFSQRKGADLLPKIMQKLGNNFVLFTTTGLQDTNVAETENIVSIGKLNQSELLEYYNYCDIFLFPTRLEGLSLTTLEAMACGMPVVTTNCFSMPELVVDGKGGYLCELDNVDMFVQSIQKIIDDKELTSKLSAFNRQHIEDNFSLTQMTEKYINLYDSLLTNR